MNLLVYIIAYPFIWLISRLNFSTIYLISDFLYYFLYYVFSYRKSVVRENLKLAFPKMPKKERLEIEKNNFRNLTDIFLETFKSINVSEDELKSFCREHLAGFKMPKTFVFQELPKTSTGKIQKFELRKKF